VQRDHVEGALWEVDCACLLRAAAYRLCAWTAGAPSSSGFASALRASSSAALASARSRDSAGGPPASRRSPWAPAGWRMVAAVAARSGPLPA